MSDVRFYHLKSQTLDEALPALVMKAYDNGKKRILIRMPNKTDAERINTLLWTFKPDVFLPHASDKEGQPEKNPVFITAQTEGNLNEASVLIACNGADTKDAGEYGLVCEIFADHDQDIVTQARTTWARHKEAGHTLTYWQQTPNGGWEQKA